MNSTLPISSATSPLSLKRASFESISSSSRCLLPVLRLSRSKFRYSFSLRVTAASSSTSSDQNPSGFNSNPFFHCLRSFAATTIFLGAAFSVSGITHKLPARAEPKIPVTVSEQEGVDALESVLQQKLENGEDDEALGILNRLVDLQPEETELNLLKAKLLRKKGDTQNARKLFDEILERDPLSFEALFENSLLMDRCGEVETAIKRVEEAIKVAKEEGKEIDASLMMALVKFLQKNADDALKSYSELCKENPDDFRPYFCQGMIYNLLDRHEDAKEMLDKYNELCPKKFKAVCL